MATINATTPAGGFRNLLARENKLWWGGRQWLLQGLLGVAGLGGLLAFILFVLPGMVPAGEASLDPREGGAQIFFGLGALFLALDVIILTQDMIIGEKQSGVAEWVLSKPVSRPAYLLAKLLANSLGILVMLILLPGLVAYVLFSLAGLALPAADFAPALAILALHTFFYLALALLMGVVSESRGLFLAVTLGSLLGGALLLNLLGRAAFVTPWPLGNVAVALALGAPLAGVLWLPVVATAVLALLAIGGAIWRFEQAEL